MKIVLLSYTPIDAPGGVPRWNRDFASAFGPGEVVHYSWLDVVRELGRDGGLHEWEKAKVLAGWLKHRGLVSKEDIIVGDGFWADGFDGFPKVVSVAHGIWSHLTERDVAAGRQPEFPQHHAAQVAFRRKFLKSGGKIVAVSKFISHQMFIQWGFGSYADGGVPVINNAVDKGFFRPAEWKVPRKRPVVVHGVTTANKGFDHIEAIKKNIPDADVLLLDEAERHFGIPKYDALAQADLVVHPSAYEGNSYFVMETLASGVPIFGYDVGYLWQLFGEGKSSEIGRVVSKEWYHPAETANLVRDLLDQVLSGKEFCGGPALAVGIDEFRSQWRSYLEKEFGYASSDSCR